MSPLAWFSGEHPTALDAEGRILLPVGLRNLLNPGREDVTLMASLEPEGCLCVRRVEQWDAYVQRLRERAGNGTRDRRLTMILAATSAPMKLDRQGRMRIPDALLERAGVPREGAERREVVVAGHFDDLRVWSSERWQAFSSEAVAAFGADLHLLEAEPAGAPGSESVTEG